MIHFRTKLVASVFVLAATMSVSACGGAEKEGGATAETAVGHAQAGGEQGGGDTVTIPAASAEASGVKTAEAGPGAIRETLNLTGRILLQPAARADVHAPYPGPVRAVSHNVGDQVRRGETLVRVESAESLQTYSVTSPIAGVVLERQTNIGDVTGEEALFVIGDLSRLQAELNVVTRDVGRVAPGQDVIITGLDGSTRVAARIASVLPTADAHSQSLIARAPIASSTSALRPGMSVRGAVVLTERRAPVVVATEAVQTWEGKSVVFVRTAPDTYQARPVTTGRPGEDTIEVTTGLAAGETYVSENAFLVKAEIGKGSASHED